MNPFEAIEKLITEHGSATILRERITQAKESRRRWKRRTLR
jgi:hypothetical protein